MKIIIQIPDKAVDAAAAIIKLNIKDDDAALIDKAVARLRDGDPVEIETDVFEDQENAMAMTLALTTIGEAVKELKGQDNG